MKKNYTRETFKTREDWLNARGLGGSSASAIVGDSPYETRIELLEKIVLPKQEEVEDRTNEEAKQHGNIVEPALRTLFQGKGNPVGQIFLGKNDSNYVDEVKHTVKTSKIDELDEEEIMKKYVDIIDITDKKA